MADGAFHNAKHSDLKQNSRSTTFFRDICQSHSIQTLDLMARSVDNRAHGTSLWITEIMRVTWFVLCSPGLNSHQLLLAARLEIEVDVGFAQAPFAGLLCDFVIRWALAPGMQWRQRLAFGYLNVSFSKFLGTIE